MAKAEIAGEQIVALDRRRGGRRIVEASELQVRAVIAEEKKRKRYNDAVKSIPRPANAIILVMKLNSCRPWMHTSEKTVACFLRAARFWKSSETSAMLGN